MSRYYISDYCEHNIPRIVVVCVKLIQNLLGYYNFKNFSNNLVYKIYFVFILKLNWKYLDCCNKRVYVFIRKFKVEVIILLDKCLKIIWQN